MQTMFDKSTAEKLKKAQNGGDGVKEATWDVTEGQEGEQAAWSVLDPTCCHGHGKGISMVGSTLDFTGYFDYAATYKWEALMSLCAERPAIRDISRT